MSHDATDILTIRDLNDQFRATLSPLHGDVVVTRGVHECGEAFFAEALAVVRSFSRFTPQNDPFGEHDFGDFEHRGEQLYWKIDYYDPDWTYRSADPADATRTKRVLTLMLAEEY
jgi:hypothetical protein